mgnify:CR=1 FL=1
MGRPRHTSVAEQNVWMEQRITELEERADKQFNIGFTSGYQSGMERAAEIAHEMDYGMVEIAIRKEIEK